MNGPFGLNDLSNDDASDNLQIECRHVDGTMNRNGWLADRGRRHG